jgi:hypothetical protein
MYVIRLILWPATMSYAGFILTGQGLRTFNSLSMTEALLGGLTGILLAIMFTLREKRRRRSAIVHYSIEEMFPDWNVPLPRRKRDNR